MSTNANDTSAAKKQLWKGITAHKKKGIMHISALRDTDGIPVAWSASALEPCPPVFTTVPMEHVQDPEGIEAVRATVEALLCDPGPCNVTFYVDDTKAPTGELVIRTPALNDAGAALLNRGSWNLIEPKPGEAADERGLFVFKGQAYGTSDKPTYTTKTDNAMELRWDPSKAPEGGGKFPAKSMIYAVLEKHATAMYRHGVGLSTMELIDPETGGAANEGETQGVNKVEFAAGWFRTQTRVVHAHIPAYAQLHDDDSVPPKMSHGGAEKNDGLGKGKGKGKGGTKGKGGENGRARPEMFALRLRFPTGFYKENTQIVDNTNMELGIDVQVDNHPFPQYAIRDTMSSITAGQPMKEGKECSQRALLRVTCVVAKTCPGVTHPADVSAWLFAKLSIHYIGCAFTQEMVSKGDSPTATAYSYGVLVDKKDPLQMMKLADHTLSGSDSVTIRQWNSFDTAQIKVLSKELYVADGAVSVVRQKKQESVRATTAYDLTIRMAEEAKQLATKTGLEESGYAASTQRNTTELLTMQRKLDQSAHSSHKKLLAAQVKAVELEEAAAAQQEYNERMSAAAAEQPAQESGSHASAPKSKHKRKEMTIKVVTDSSDFAEFPMEVEDVPATGPNSSSPTLFDLVFHLHSLDCFGSDYGIVIQDCPGFKGADLEVAAYVVVNYEIDGKTMWSITVGKDSGSRITKLEPLNAGTLVMRPRLAAKPGANHPDWLKCTLVAVPESPSPAKQPGAKRPVRSRVGARLTAVVRLVGAAPRKGIGSRHWMRSPKRWKAARCEALKRAQCSRSSNRHRHSSNKLSRSKSAAHSKRRSAGRSRSRQGRRKQRSCWCRLKKSTTRKGQAIPRSYSSSCCVHAKGSNWLNPTLRDWSKSGTTRPSPSSSRPEDQRDVQGGIGTLEINDSEIYMEMNANMNSNVNCELNKEYKLYNVIDTRAVNGREGASKGDSDSEFIESIENAQTTKYENRIGKSQTERDHNSVTGLALRNVRASGDVEHVSTVLARFAVVQSEPPRKNLLTVATASNVTLLKHCKGVGLVEMLQDGDMIHEGSRLLTDRQDPILDLAEAAEQTESLGHDPSQNAIRTQVPHELPVPADGQRVGGIQQSTRYMSKPVPGVHLGGHTQESGTMMLVRRGPRIGPLAVPVHAAAAEPAKGVLTSVGDALKQLAVREIVRTMSHVSVVLQKVRRLESGQELPQPTVTKEQRSDIALQKLQILPAPAEAVGPPHAATRATIVGCTRCAIVCHNGKVRKKLTLRALTKVSNGNSRQRIPLPGQRPDPEIWELTKDGFGKNQDQTEFGQDLTEFGQNQDFWKEEPKRECGAPGRPRMDVRSEGARCGGGPRVRMR
jgi:hypothetical protein